MADDKNKGGGSGDLGTPKTEIKGTGIFGSLDEGISAIKGSFESGGLISNIVKIAKVTGLAALAVGGLVASQKLKEAGTIENLGNVLNDIQNGEGIAKLMNPAEKAKEEEPIKIPSKNEIKKSKPEGDLQAKKDKRKAKAEKVSGAVPTKVALENVAKMNQLSKRTKDIMESYGLKSARSVDMIELTPKQTPVPQSAVPIGQVEQSIPTGPQQVTTQNIVTSYQVHGGKFESLLAANNELLSIISNEIELIHTNMVTATVAKNARSKLMEILADKDNKVAEKIQEQNASIESVSDKMLKNIADAKNKTNENLSEGTGPKASGPNASEGSKLTKIGEVLGDITKLAIPLLIKKSYDILTEDNPSKQTETNKELNDKVDQGKIRDKNGNIVLKKDGVALAKTQAGITNTVHDRIEDAHNFLESFDELTDNDFSGGKLKWIMSVPLAAAIKTGRYISDLFEQGTGAIADRFGEDRYTDDKGNRIYAKQIDTRGYQMLDDGTYAKIDETKHPGEEGYFVVRSQDSENGKAKAGDVIKYDLTDNGFIERPEGKTNKGGGGRSAASVKSNVRGVGRQISIGSSSGKLTGFNGAANKGPDKGVSYEAGGNTPWNPSDAQASALPNPPDMDPEAATAANNAVQAMKDLEAKIVYSQTGGRNPYGGDHTSDCSSTVQHVLKRAAGVDPGFNTVSQIMNKEGVWVDRSTIQVDGSGEGKVPDESKLRPGDLLFFRPNNPARRDKSRPYQVGHVEMYVGNGQMMGQTGEAPGHKGPVYHPLTKQWLVNGYIGAKRFILNKTNPVNSVDDAVGNYMKEHGIINQSTGQIESGAQLDSAVENFKKSMNSQQATTEPQGVIQKVKATASSAVNKIGDMVSVAPIAGSVASQANTIATVAKALQASQPQQPIIIPQQGGGGNTVVNNDSHDTYYITNDGSSNSDIRRK